MAQDDADKTNGPADVDSLPVRLLVVCKTKAKLTGVVSYLQRRGWPCVLSVRLDEAVKKVVADKPDFVLLSFNHPASSSPAILDFFQKSLNTPVIAFGETLDVTTVNRINVSSVEYKILNQISGPAVQRRIRQILLARYGGDGSTEGAASHREGASSDSGLVTHVSGRPSESSGIGVYRGAGLAGDISDDDVMARMQEFMRQYGDAGAGMADPGNDIQGLIGGEEAADDQEGGSGGVSTGPRWQPLEGPEKEGTGDAHAKLVGLVKEKRADELKATEAGRCRPPFLVTQGREPEDPVLAAVQSAAGATDLGLLQEEPSPVTGGAPLPQLGVVVLRLKEKEGLLIVGEQIHQHLGAWFEEFGRQLKASLKQISGGDSEIRFSGFLPLEARVLSGMQGFSEFSLEATGTGYHLLTQFISHPQTLPKVERSESQGRYIIRPGDLVAGHPLNFSVAIYLPQNDKFIEYARPGTILTHRQIDKLASAQLETSISPESLAAYYESFLAGVVLALAGGKETAKAG